MSARSFVAARPRLLILLAFLLGGTVLAVWSSQREVAPLKSLGADVTQGATRSVTAQRVATAKTAPLTKRHAKAMRRLIAQQQHAAQRHTAWLQSPKAKQQRARSKVAFRDLPAPQAVTVAEHHQPSLMNRDTQVAPQLQPGEKLSAIPSATGAMVEKKGPNGKLMKAMVESTGVPIAAPDPAHPHSELKPIDLKLLDEGDHFRPARGAVSLELPKVASDGATLAGYHVGLTRTPAKAVVVDDKKTIYPGTDKDTDAVLEPTNDGLEVSWLLRSPAAPQLLPLSIVDAQGAGLSYEITKDGSATLKSAGKTVGQVMAPTAWDAQNTPVPAKLVLQDGKLGVAVPHVGHDLAYPIAVDPYVYVGGLPSIQETDFNQFQFYRSTQNDAIVSGSAGLDSGGQFDAITMSPSKGSARSTWFYDPIRDSRAFRVEFWQFHRDPGSTCVTMGLWGWNTGYNDTGWGAYWNSGNPPNSDGSNFNGAAPGAFGNCGGGIDGMYVQACEERCGWTGGRVTPNNLAQWEVGTSGTSGTNLYHRVRNAVVFHRESDAPGISALNVPAGNNGWTDGHINGSISGDDGGIGFCGDRNYYGPDVAPTLSVNAPGIAANTDWGGCAGFTYYQPAPSHIDMGFGDGGGIMPEGDPTASFTLRDMFGNATATTRQFHVDRTGPVVSPGGRLSAYFTPRSGRTGPLPADIKTYTGAADFVMSVKDSRSGINTSGLDGANSGSWVVALDDAGNRISTPVHLMDTISDCTGGAANCDMAARRWPSTTFDSLAPGLYQLETDVRDRAGNQTLDVEVFAKGGGDITTVADGQGTAKWVPLVATRTAGAPTKATFQWRTGTRAWEDIPGSALYSESTKQQMGCASVLMNGTINCATSAPAGTGATARYVLDIDDLIAAKGDLTADNLQLRAVFDGAGSVYDKTSESVGIRLDRGGRDTSDANRDMGPGSVDLLTGNLAVQRTDAVLPGYQSDITLDRTYGSRYSAVGSLLGPGWRAAVNSAATGGFMKVIDMDDPARDIYDNDPSLWNDSTAIPEWRYPAVRVETADGSGFVFEQRESDGAYVPETGFENYSLARSSTNSGQTTQNFVLTDNDTGARATFATRADRVGVVTRNAALEHGTFALTSVYKPGEPGQPTWTYAMSNSTVAFPGISAITDPTQLSVIASKAVMVPVRVTTSTDGAVACPGSGTLPRGCRALDLTYGLSPLANGPRMVKTTLTAWDPAAGAQVTSGVSQYDYDSNGRLSKATSLRSGLAEQYAYDANGLLSSVTPAGRTPFTMTYASQSWDKTAGRLSTTSRDDGGVAATQKLIYDGPTFSGANPWDMSTTQVGKWDQKVTPFRATAVFDAMTTPGTDAPSLRKASISYLDALGRVVNQASPSDSAVGRITATDYDKLGNVTRSLSAANRSWAMAQTNTVDAARRMSSYTTYELDTHGSERPIRTLGPEHDVKTSAGTVVRGRSFTTNAYDESDAGFVLTDPKMPYNLPTTTSSGALTGTDAFGAGGSQQGVRVTKLRYEATKSDGSKWRTPTKLIEQKPDGTVLRTTQTVLDDDGREIERRQPSAPGTAAAGSADAASTTKTVYWTSGTNARSATCGNRPEWVGLVCEVGPAAQPAAATAMPGLPVKHVEYDYWRRVAKVVDTVTTASGASETRTSTTTFDSKDRPSVESITGGSGTTVQNVRHVYDDVTGDEVRTEQLTGTTVDRFVKRTFDSLGRVGTYEDSTGGKEVTSYDRDGRPTTVTDSNNGTSIAVKTYGYDAATGDVTSLGDSSLDATNPMTATYDADGRPITVTYPSGFRKSLVYDETGAVGAMTYVKTTNCTASCLWYSDSVTRSVNGQVTDDASSFSTRAYTYDDLGRLSKVADQTTGSTCATRSYTYDANSNRLTKRSETGAAGAACPAGTGGTVVTSTYDAADRLKTTDGYGLGAAAPTYDSWGRITNLPKQAAGGGLAVSSTYYVNDLAKSVVNGTVTVTNEIDPMGRIRTRTTQTNGQSTVPIETYAYGDDSDEPIFTRTATAAAPGTETGWTHFVEDPTGDLAAQVSKSGAKYLEVDNIHGDTVAELAASATATGLSSKFAVDEFGVPTGTTMGQRKYGFLGGKQRESIQYGAIVAMGVRSYSPQAGRFLQTDPVPGGSANAYDYTNQDPINQFDLGGQCVGPLALACLEAGEVIFDGVVALGSRYLVRRAAAMGVRELVGSTAKAAERNAVKAVAKAAFNKNLRNAGVKNGLRWSLHALEQAAGREGNGVSTKAIQEVIAKGKVVGRGGGVVSLETDSAHIVINQVTGKIITVWARGEDAYRIIPKGPLV